MSVERLDYIFPFIVLVYGLVMVLVLHSATLMKLAREKLPSEEYQRFTGHRGLGWVCFFVGGLWSLQNLWFY